MSKEEIIRIIKCYEQDRYFGVLPEDKYECVANDIFKLSNQNTKPLIEKISSLEASLLDVTRKSCARVDELKDEIAELRKALNQIQDYQMDFVELARTTTVYKIAESALNKLKASKSEANEAVESQEDILRELISLIQTSSSVGIIMQKFTITRNNK